MPHYYKCQHLLWFFSCIILQTYNTTPPIFSKAHMMPFLWCVLFFPFLFLLSFLFPISCYWMLHFIFLTLFMIMIVYVLLSISFYVYIFLCAFIINISQSGQEYIAAVSWFIIQIIIGFNFYFIVECVHITLGMDCR